MKYNFKKRCGFGLVEVIISMAIMGIISISVYNAYVLAIKHTKDGQVKQAAALEGKKVIEDIKSTDIQLPTNINDSLQITNNISLKKQPTPNVYTRFLDGNFSATDETVAKYAEMVTISQTKTNIGNINFSDNQNTEVNSNDINYEFNISKEQPNNTINDYINYGENNQQEIQGQDKIILSMYLDKPNANSRSITIKDYKGVTILNSGNLQFSSGKINISINFNDYKQIGNSVPKPVVINMYNSTTDIPNIIVEKANTVTADVEIFKGQMNLYGNRAENPQEAKVGSLYDIKVELMDYTQYIYDQTHTHDEKNNLFTAYYNQNIQQ